MTGLQRRIGGLFSAITTPFDDEGRFDRQILKRHVDHLVERGIAGLVPSGGTGEASALSLSEKVEVVGATVEVAARRVPVIAGITTPGLVDTIDLGRRCLAAGADGLMVITPFGTAPTQAGIRRYYKAVSEGVGQPVMLYEIPYLTGTALQADTVAEMAEDGSIDSMKASNPDMVRFEQVLRYVGDKIKVMSGDEDQFALQVALGAAGGVLATTNILPKTWIEIFEHARMGRLGDARDKHAALSSFLRDVYSQPNPGPMKAALKLAGFAVGGVRLPNILPDEVLVARLQNALAPLLAYERSL